MRKMLLALVAAVAAAALAPAPRAAAADKVRFVQSSWGFLFVPAMVAKELGHFGEQGVEAEFTIGLGGAEALAAAVAGNAEIYVGAPSSALRSREKGTDAIVFGASITQYASNVVVSKERAAQFGVTEASPFEDKLKVLKGGNFGVVGFGSGTHQLLLFLARKAGLDAARDMTFVNVTTGEAALAAFGRRRIDGFSFSSPTSDIAVRDHDGIMLFHTTKGEVKDLDGFLYIGLIAREAWLKEKPDLARRVLKGVQAALDDLNDPQRTQTARDAIHAKYHPKVEKAFFDQLWADTIPAWPRTVAVTPEMATRVVDFLNQFSTTPYDTKLARTGFDFELAQAAAKPGR